MARNSELVKTQIKDLEVRNLDAVRQHKPRSAASYRNSNSTSRGRQPQHRQGRQRNVTIELCDKCNRQHGDAVCPAQGRKCRKYKRLHHFAVCCRASRSQYKPNYKQVHEVAEDQESDDTFFLRSVTNCDDQSKAWDVKLKVCNQNLTFKIDTGADRSIITESTYNSLSPKPKLSSVTSQLQSPGGILKCEGDGGARVCSDHFVERKK
ncbi:hypothetical protein ScPMuIL_006907 [Solemya velum]